MRLYRKKFLNIKILILIFFLISLCIFSILKKIDTNQKAEILNLIESQNFGFSTVGNLKKKSEVYKGAHIPFYLVRSIKNILLYKINGQKFEKLSFDINFKNYLKILNDKKIAENNGFLLNKKFTDAIINFKGKKYKAQIRLKGSPSDHFDGYRRFSFRVKLKDDKSILGFKKFSIHRPEARQYPYDYVFGLINRDAGILYPAKKFAEIVVNGQAWGVMDIEEHFDSSFLEKQRRKDSILLSLGDDQKSELISKIIKKNILVIGNPIDQIIDWYLLSDQKYGPNLFNQKKYLKNDYNRILYTYASSEILKKNKKIYDQNILMKSILLCAIWGNYHSIININSRLYFNPYTLKLEYIPTDQAEINKIDKLKNGDHFDRFSEQISTNLIDFNEENFSKNLADIRKLTQDHNKYFIQAKQKFPVDLKIDSKILNQNINLLTYKNLKDLISSKLIKSPLDVEIFRENSSIFPKHIYFNHFDDGRIEIYNLLPDTIKINKIFIKENEKNRNVLNEILIPSYLDKKNPIIIKTNFVGNLDGKIFIETEYNGAKKKQVNNFSLVSDNYFNPLNKEITNCNNCFKKIDGNYFFKKGDWKIDNLLVFNGDLTIEAGTKIKFGDKSGLIVNGSLMINGDLDQPIIMESINSGWQGIYVYNSNKKSYIKNAILKNLTGIDQGLLKLTGSINFYNSDLLISNVFIENNKSEDAINLVNSNFEITKLNIQNSISDGIDFDFSSGSLTNSNFSKINGDAIDASGSTIFINKVSIEDVRDKAISAGENSSISINESKFNKIGVGVASKDGSRVEVLNSIFSNYKLYSIMSYNKKNIYGPSKMIVKNSKFEKNKLIINQYNNFISVDNIEINESYLNVKDLYQSSTMKK